MSSALDLRPPRTRTSTPVVTNGAHGHRGRDSYDHIEPLLTELAGLAPSDRRRNNLRNTAIRRCLPLADNIARRFTGRGESLDDLRQVARLGLVHAVDRFDHTHGAPFLAFAIPTIMGEVRRHFRDHTWAVRVPRRVKEIHQQLGPTTEALTHRFGRPPKAREIAEELGVDTTEVTQAMIAHNAYRTAPIEPITDDENPGVPEALLAVLGADEPEYGVVEDYLSVRPLIAALPEQDRRALVLRFFEFRTQRQIAAQLGVSQMQVSRILSRTLDTLRERALHD